MTESEFISAIDARFPYDAPLKWKRWVAIAPRISSDAAFFVVHELCRPPRSSSSSFSERRRILDHLEHRFRHPLLSSLRNLIHIMMRGERVSVSTALAAMRRVSRYPHQHNMLAVCYFSSFDRYGRLDDLYEAIVAKWATMHEAAPVKDGTRSMPVPTAWRPAFHAIVDAFLDRDFMLKRGVRGVEPVSIEKADHIQDYLGTYGATLMELPDETWATSVCQWCGNHWDVFVDLWTQEEGRSDLVLSARVTERHSGFAIDIHMVYVP